MVSGALAAAAAATAADPASLCRMKALNCTLLDVMVDPKVEAHEAGYIFLVPPKGHQVYTLTKFKKEPYIHSPRTVR